MQRLGNFLKTKLSRKAEGATFRHLRPNVFIPVVGSFKLELPASPVQQIREYLSWERGGSGGVLVCSTLTLYQLCPGYKTSHRFMDIWNLLPALNGNPETVLIPLRVIIVRNTRQGLYLTVYLICILLWRCPDRIFPFFLPRNVLNQVQRINGD